METSWAQKQRPIKHTILLGICVTFELQPEQLVQQQLLFCFLLGDLSSREGRRDGVISLNGYTFWFPVARRLLKNIMNSQGESYGVWKCYKLHDKVEQPLAAFPVMVWRRWALVFIYWEEQRTLMLCKWILRVQQKLPRVYKKKIGWKFLSTGVVCARNIGGEMKLSMVILCSWVEMDDRVSSDSVSPSA